MVIQLVKLIILSAAVFVLTHAARRAYFSDIVPIAFAEPPQASWRVQGAFLLMSVELLTAALTILAVAFLAVLVSVRAVTHAPLAGPRR